MLALFLRFWGYFCVVVWVFFFIISKWSRFFFVSAFELENERWMESQETKGNSPLLESGLWPQICCMKWASHLACASASQSVNRDYNCFSRRCFSIHIWKALSVINIQACDVWHEKIPCCLITGALWMFFDIKTAAGSLQNNPKKSNH